MRGGFTLIELLVVVAVIAILVGLTVPALTLVREEARRSVCRSNLRQIGTAIQMYGNRWGGVGPFEGNMGNTVWDGVTAVRRIGAGRVFAFLSGDARVFFCPSQQAFTRDDAMYGVGSFDVTGKSCRGAYAVRGSVQFGLGATEGVMLDRYAGKVCATDVEAPSVDPLRRAHRDGLNGVRVDGSVQWFPGEQKLASESYQAYWDRLDAK